MVTIKESGRVFALALMCVLNAALVSACGGKQDAEPEAVVRPVKVMHLGGSGSGATRTFPGRVRAAERVDLSFRVTGILAELNARQGQRVNKGDVIARLDQRDFKANLSAAEAEFIEAKSNYERGRELVKEGHISKVDFDKLKARFEVTRANRDKAQKAFDDSSLLAPFSGVVAKRYVENFQKVRLNDTIVSLQDTSTLEVVVDAPERIVAGRRGQGTAELEAVFESLPGQRFALSIKEFATVADPDTQTFEYVMTLPKPEGANILPGMTVSVIARRTDRPSEEMQTHFIVPAAAVFADEAGQSQVWVIGADNITERRPVTTGRLTGNDAIEIVKGLGSGETIAVAGVTQLREGEKVNPVERIEF